MRRILPVLLLLLGASAPFAQEAPGAAVPEDSFAAGANPPADSVSGTSAAEEGAAAPDATTVDAASSESVAETNAALLEEERGSAASGSSFWKASPTIDPWRTAIFGGLILGTYGAAYGLVFAKGWWDESGGDFHFGNDFDYALNLDKGGHAFSGQLMGEFFYDGLTWSGFSHNAARGFAGLGAFLTHVAIDVKDGYAPEWGFSAVDVLSDTAGGFWPWLQELWSPLDAIEFKASYWKNSNTYWERGGTSSGVFTDDYVNWTFWASWRVERALPKAAARFWPDWLCLAFGFSIDDSAVLSRADGEREFYVALDWDLEEIFKPESRALKRLVSYANTIKLPSPAVRLYPSHRRELLLVYPILF